MIILIVNIDDMSSVLYPEQLIDKLQQRTISEVAYETCGITAIQKPMLYRGPDN